MRLTMSASPLRFVLMRYGITEKIFGQSTKIELTVKTQLLPAARFNLHSLTCFLRFPSIHPNKAILQTVSPENRQML